MKLFRVIVVRAEIKNKENTMADIKKAKSKVLEDLMDTMGQQSLKAHPKRMGVTIVIGDRGNDPIDESPLHESLESPREEKVEQEEGDDDPISESGPLPKEVIPETNGEGAKTQLSKEEDIEKGDGSPSTSSELMKRLKRLRSN